MPRLRQNQREQVIGRLQAGERPRVITNAMNCSVRTIERLRERYNATNSTAIVLSILKVWLISCFNAQRY